MINKNSFYLIIAGTRTFEDYDTFLIVTDFMLQNKKDVVIVSGGARGVDKMAERYAKEKGYEIRIFLADWELYGKAAGYIRNKRMHDFVAQYKNRGCLLFWDGKSKGTKQNIELAKTRNTQLKIVRIDKEES